VQPARVAFGLTVRDTARMGSIRRIHARCVGGPENGALYDLEVTPNDDEALEAMKIQGSKSLSERYRLVDRETTGGEAILVYIGEPRQA